MTMINNMINHMVNNMINNMINNMFDTAPPFPCIPIVSPPPSLQESTHQTPSGPLTDREQHITNTFF